MNYRTLGPCNYHLSETQTQDRIQTFLRKDEIGDYLQDLQARSNLKNIKEVVFRNAHKKSKEAEERFNKLTERIKNEKDTFFFVVIDEGNIFPSFKCSSICRVNFYLISLTHYNFSPFCCQERKLHS